MEEIWKKIDWIPNLRGNYEVSNMGNARRTSLLWHDHRTNTYKTINRTRLLSLYDNGHGYLHVSFMVDTENGKKLKNFYVHRLVAEAFIPNPDGKKDINHKNFIRTDNRVSNLEWVTFEENMKHSSSMDRRLKPHYPSSGSCFKPDLSAQREEERAIRALEKKSKQRHKKKSVPNKDIKRTNIYFHSGKYTVRLYHNGKRYYVGRYSTYDEAVKAKVEMLKELGLI